MKDDKTGMLKIGNVALLVIDLQEKFRDVIFEMERVIDRTKRLIEVFQILKLPIIVTEQNPGKLGKTVNEIRKVLENYKPVEKMQFSCFDNDNFVKELKRYEVGQLVISGIESHICVLKTALDGVKNGYEVHVVYDAISSRNRIDWEISRYRMIQSDIYVESYESVVFQLIKEAGTEEFRKILKVVK